MPINQHCQLGSAPRIECTSAGSVCGRDLNRWRGLGVVDSVLKPFNLDLLSGKVQEVL
ncbi:MAG TPA: hypothetical protein VK009_02420 [Chloroflexota bacterium]|nr:hypothetical protein [Chloroflexota bacterium]